MAKRTNKTIKIAVYVKLLLITAVLSLTGCTSSQLNKKYKPIVFEIMPDSLCLNGHCFGRTQYPFLWQIEQSIGYKGKKKKIGVYKTPYYEFSKHNIIFMAISINEMAEGIEIFFDPSYNGIIRVKKPSNVILKINGHIITKETTKADLESYLNSTIVNGKPVNSSIDFKKIYYYYNNNKLQYFSCHFWQCWQWIVSDTLRLCSLLHPMLKLGLDFKILLFSGMLTTQNQKTKFRRNKVLVVLTYLLFTMACKVSEKDKMNEKTTATTFSSIRYQPEELETDTRETILPFDSLKLTLVKSYSKTAFFETFADDEAKTKVRIRHREVMINLTRNDITYNKILTINTFRNYFGKQLPDTFIFHNVELDSIDVKNHMVKFVVYLNVSDTDVRCVLNLVVNTQTFEDRWIVIEKP